MPIGDFERNVLTFTLSFDVELARDVPEDLLNDKELLLKAMDMLLNESKGGRYYHESESIRLSVAHEAEIALEGVNSHLAHANNRALGGAERVSEFNQIRPRCGGVVSASWFKVGVVSVTSRVINILDKEYNRS